MANETSRHNLWLRMIAKYAPEGGRSEMSETKRKRKKDRPTEPPAQPRETTLLVRIGNISQVVEMKRGRLVIEILDHDEP